MSHRLEIRPQALADIADAAAWYENRQAGLGERFIHETIAAIDSLATGALLHRVRHRRLGARWYYPVHFPYRIIYFVAGEVATIVGVIHAARQSRHWQSRFRTEGEENP